MIPVRVSSEKMLGKLHTIVDSDSVLTLTAGQIIVASTTTEMRDSPTSVVIHIAGVNVRLHPAEAHELGTKLRRMARKART